MLIYFSETFKHTYNNIHNDPVSLQTFFPFSFDFCTTPTFADLNILSWIIYPTWDVLPTTSSSLLSSIITLTASDVCGLNFSPKWPLSYQLDQILWYHLKQTVMTVLPVLHSNSHLIFRCCSTNLCISWDYLPLQAPLLPF